MIDRLALNESFPDIGTFSHTWVANGIYVFDLSTIPGAPQDQEGPIGTTSTTSISSETITPFVTGGGNSEILPRQFQLGYNTLTANVTRIPSVNHGASSHATPSERKDNCPK